MTNDPENAAVRAESRWPPVIALALLVALLYVLPRHVVFLPVWISHACAVAAFAAMAAAGSIGTVRWLRIERALIMLLGVVFAINTGAQLADLVGVIAIRPKETAASTLLSSAVGIWIENIVIFSMLYWQVDGGGPYGRAIGVRRGPDWGFPAPPAQDAAPHAAAPQYVDYLFLAFNTATAFSPTDVSPYTRRAKLLMTAESAISLVTLVVVLSRAINVLPG